MVRKAQPQSITPKMYRHFAVLTLAVTGTVALFANGESRDAMASEVQRMQKPRPVAGPVELVRKDTAPRSASGWDDGADGSFGEPMDAEGASAEGGIIPADFAAADGIGIPASETIYGVSQAAWARMSETQRKELIARYEKEQAAARAPERAAQIEALRAASRARAGRAGAAD